ncbi:MAG TPA: VOC family protein [Solirubrobacteraceae bacterium]|nr:VOC family protein [Solirubrobacteraceae bacterium]
MLDHVGFSVSDYQRSKAFYERALAPLGLSLLMEPIAEVAGFGEAGKPWFWIETRRPASQPAIHVAFAVGSRETVDAFHAAALEAGGTDNGAPGVREIYHPHHHANGAWTVLAALTHNLLRWTELLGLPGTVVRAARTVRRRLLALPGRLTRHARGWTLHLPARWPWQGDFEGRPRAHPSAFRRRLTRYRPPADPPASPARSALPADTTTRAPRSRRNRFTDPRASPGCASPSAHSATSPTPPSTHHAIACS